jgi:hypothetical protein
MERAEDLLHARPDVHDFGGNQVDVRPLMLLAGAVLAGAAGYTLYTMRQSRHRPNEDHRRPARR